MTNKKGFRPVAYTGTDGMPSVSYCQFDHMEIYGAEGLREHANKLILKQQRKIDELETRNETLEKDQVIFEDKICSLEDQLQWSLKNEQQYKDALKLYQEGNNKELDDAIKKIE